LPQGRRVRRVIRKVDPWTVLRFSVFFYLSIFLVMLVAGVALWQVGSATGVRDNAEGFVGELVGAGPTTDPAGGAASTDNTKDNNFRFEGGRILQASALGGLVLVVVGTGANVLLVVLYNLISDVAGGVEITVLEEDTTSRPVI
jgi:Transmembrane domain of unknown function (DUF3566)